MQDNLRPHAAGKSSPERFIPLSERVQLMVDRAESAHVPKPPFPQNIMVELSNACNHACVFCANPKMTRRIGRINERLLFSIMAQGQKLGAREIGFYTTGDPFVHRDLEKFVREAKRLGYEYTYLSTNGALATPQRVQVVVDAGIDSIKFSINAGSRKTYQAIHGFDDWEKVNANLRFVSEYRRTLARRLKLAITFVVIDQNRHEIEGFREAFGPLVDDIYFSQGHHQQGYMMENLTFIKEFKPIEATDTPVKAPCYMLFSRAHVTCEGYLTLCCVDYQNYLAVADLKEQGLLDAWHNPEFVKMRERHLKDDLKGTLCWNCIRGVQDPLKPLVDRFATAFNFAEVSQDNLKKQRARFQTPGSSGQEENPAH